MLKSIAVLIACSVGCLVLAHEHCHYDEREVDPDGVLTYCSMEFVTSGTCCTAEEEAALEATFNAAGSLTAECADYYQQTLCGVCGSFSGHLYERFAAELGTENGLTMKAEFCTALTTACAGQIDFPDFGGIGYCTVVTGGGDEDLLWSYPYEEEDFFDGDFNELFPDLPELPDTTIAMHQSPDDSMYWIAGKDGLLVRIDADSPSTSSTVMDLSGGIFLSTPEEGLLDFAFSPMFGTNGYFYVSWTVREDGIDKNRLSKFEYVEGDPDATRNSEEMFLETSERPNFFHNGGWVGFKPSDYGNPADYHDLYWALGDAGRQQDPFDHGQRTDVLFGSVVRISVPSDGTGYLVPDGNYPGAVLPEICAIGFRNIWRCSFDRLTDDLYCGDVGHNEIESIDIVECGNNYGWVRFEGSRCTPYSEDTYGSCVDTDRSGFTFPIFEYCHVDYDSTLATEVDYTNGIDICGDRSVIGNAVIGGYVYRGQAYADLIYGAYVFGDHELGNIYYIMQEEDGTWTTGTILDENVPILSFAEDNDGELFIIDERNTIFYLPCGNLCDDDDDTTTPVDDPTDDITDDDTTTPAAGDDDRTTTYEFIGCYGDQSDRVLSGLSLPGYAGLTTEFCAGFCTGSAYFGTQFGVQCFCGEATDDPTILGPADCGTPCAGDSTDTCGGRWALSVYQYWI